MQMYSQAATKWRDGVAAACGARACGAGLGSRGQPPWRGPAPLCLQGDARGLPCGARPHRHQGLAGAIPW